MLSFEVSYECAYYCSSREDSPKNFTTLDGKELELDPSHLLIVRCPESTFAIAGIMGAKILRSPTNADGTD